LSLSRAQLMAELPENRRRSSSSSSSSCDSSIRVEHEVGTGNESTSKEIVDSTDAVSSIGVSSGESSSSKSGFYNPLSLPLSHSLYIYIFQFCD